MPRGNRGRTGMRKTTHKTQSRRRGNSNRRKTRKNRTRTPTPRTTTPFDLVSELRNRERWERMQNLSTNPFGRTAKERYGIDTANVSGDVMSRLASRLQKRRDRRRDKRKDELTEQEQRLKRETQEAFLKEGMNLKPEFWNNEAWERELRSVIDLETDVMDPRRESSSLYDPVFAALAQPITKVTITEVDDDDDDEPSLNLSKSSLFSRRKSRKAEGNKKKKKKRKRHVTQKRKRKRKRRKR